MNTNGLKLVFVILVMIPSFATSQPPRGGSARERGGFGRPPGGMGSRIDANGDGRIDKEELGRVPEGFRNAMESRGIKLRAGVSVEEFGNNIRLQFEKRREEEMRHQDRVRSESQTSGPPPTANRGEYKPPSPFRPRERERVTVDMPPKYGEFDSDFDGQIGLYEWITTRRDDLQMFDQIDTNQDGLLTPAELQWYDEFTGGESPESNRQSEAWQRPRLTIVGGAAATAKNGKSILTKEVRKQHSDFASKKAFPYVDVNKDGVVSLEELQRDEKTRRIIPMFEKAGIKVGAMSEKEFTKKWIQAQEKFASMKQEEQGGGDSRRDRGGRSR